jgi:two-component system, chemotaxis family, protein-glutamate methylesterase/glutaminase
VTRMIRVLIVDDSAFVRRALARMLGNLPDIDVVGTAADGIEGIEQVKTLKPDVVTLDIKMPRMSGLEALRHIMDECPVPVLLLSSLTQEGADITLRGLELGAMDFVDKSNAQGNMNLGSLTEELVAKIRALAGVPHARLTTHRTGEIPLAVEQPEHTRRIEVVAIGTSTGGPTALQAIIPRLPENVAAPILVVQHMPVGFTRSLAERLNARSLVSVHEAEDGEVVVPGKVYIAPAGRHMKVRRRGSVRVWLDDEPLNALHRPSVDTLMTSVAHAYASRAMGILLTGMGSDGVEGMKAIRQAGGITLAESEETCVIYGMPKAAVEAGAAERSVPLNRMADEILQAV